MSVRYEQSGHDLRMIFAGRLDAETTSRFGLKLSQNVIPYVLTFADRRQCGQLLR